MKLLFDENVSPRLARTLAGEFPGSTHVRSIGLRGGILLSHQVRRRS